MIYLPKKTNVRTKFYESWLTNVEISKLTPPHDGHGFQQTRRNLLIKFHEDWAKNLTTVLTRRPCFFYKLETLLNSADIIRINVLPSFNEDWRINKTSRVLTRLYYSHLRKTAMPPNGHVFQPTGNIHF
ncbi:hypothetical protein DPMN_116056 [Dreissena polymorpha]|uniref:Uncharacterized protein n=1 Tax=Dreissena polymorpha TaxID=45954 RepID=A0A9D4KN55_DREPO|nr:hypothetical protein DPMN_116056 [Dreissena polymorpha]